MLLYDSAVSGTCYKARLLFAHLGLDYQRHDVDVIDRSGRMELLGDLNPALRVPTLVLDEQPLQHLRALEAVRRQVVGTVREVPQDRIGLSERTPVVAPEGGFALEPYTAVRAWLERVAAQPGHVPITA